MEVAAVTKVLVRDTAMKITNVLIFEVAFLESVKFSEDAHRLVGVHTMQTHFENVVTLSNDTRSYTTESTQSKTLKMLFVEDLKSTMVFKIKKRIEANNSEKGNKLCMTVKSKVSNLESSCFVHVRFLLTFFCGQKDALVFLCALRAILKSNSVLES